MIPWNNCLAGIGIGTPFSDEDKRLKKFTGKNTSATKFFFGEMKRDLLPAGASTAATDALKRIEDKIPSFLKTTILFIRILALFRGDRDNKYTSQVS